MHIHIFENVIKIKQNLGIENCFTHQILQKAVRFGYFICFFILRRVFHAGLYFQISFKCDKEKKSRSIIKSPILLESFVNEIHQR